MTAAYLSLRYLAHHKVRSAILTLCLAVAIVLPVAGTLLVRTYQRDLTARAEQTPMVLGAPGNRFDQTLAALYFRAHDLEPIPYAALQALAGHGLAVPLHVRFTARGHPIAGTTPEYFERRGLRAAAGTLPLRLGDVALGAKVAAALGVGPGDHVFSDQRELYDIAVPPALKMRVCGVLAAAGSPDDGALFVDVKTGWVLEGLAHGHDDAATRVADSMVLGKTEDHVALSPALIEYNEITEENADSFHCHAAPDTLPLTAVLFWPATEKDGTLAKARVNTGDEYQVLVPRTVVADLLEFVFRIKRLFDLFAALLGACTVALTVLVLWLSTRLRRGEVATLHRIGCAPRTVAKLYAVEVLFILLLAAALAGAGTFAAHAAFADLTRFL
jgi:putative ABC transport system permease protein